MTKYILPLLFSLSIAGISFGQQAEAAEKLVNEGIVYHDKGDFDAAIAKYNMALELDKDNLQALAEKAFSLSLLQKYDDVIATCKRAIESHPGDSKLPMTYVTYGNALDALKKPDQSLDVYNEGIKQFPNSYLLYFNKGITLSRTGKYDEAISCFQSAVILRPVHASSHNAMARLLEKQGKRIPALLAYCRFLITEPQSDRAKENLANVQNIMNANVEQKGEKSVTINLSADVVTAASKNGKQGENNFSSTDLILSMAAALDYDETNVNKSDVEKFARKIESVCSSLKENRDGNAGFYWEYYAPYMIEIKDKDYSKTFSYLAFASSGDTDVLNWLKGHQTELDEFYQWSKNFKWPAK